ncbi:DedA family protein [Rhodococcoides corynebacterioides]|uniref:DedA family protein n=1 Tax=Rhodococcoides corynebacterioides TaxID=53972 RepID=UPI0008332C1F|nr:DedA family protein [Rhodococcus corynebacterioides]
MDWLDAAEALVLSPWLYVILVVVSFLDSFLPAIPSEPFLVVAGVAAANGDANVTLVIVATAVGAFGGDLVPYFVGRALAAPVLRRLPPGTRRRRSLDWIGAQLAERPGLILVTSRYVPVGRYFVTLSAGISSLPWRTFGPYTAIAVVTWSIYIVMAGYLGGQALQDNMILAVLVGLTVALAVTPLTQLVLRRTVGDPAQSPQE